MQSVALPAALEQDNRILITASEASRLLSLSARKIWTLTNTGELPAVRIDRAVRYSPQALREWAAKMGGNNPR